MHTHSHMHAHTRKGQILVLTSHQLYRDTSSNTIQRVCVCACVWVCTHLLLCLFYHSSAVQELLKRFYPLHIKLQQLAHDHDQIFCISPNGIRMHTMVWSTQAALHAHTHVSMVKGFRFLDTCTSIFTIKQTKTNHKKRKRKKKGVKLSKFENHVPI